MDILNTKIKNILTEKTLKVRPENIKKDVTILGITGSYTGNLTDAEYAEANDNLDDILENTIIPSGTLSITANGTYNVTNYNEANVNVSSGGGYDPDWSEIGYESEPENMINGFDYAKEILENWDSSRDSIDSLFMDDKNLIFFPYLEWNQTDNITDANHAFANCTTLIDFPNIEINSLADASNMFENCTGLKNITLQLFSLTNVSEMFAGCTNLEYFDYMPSELIIDSGLNDFVRDCPSLNDSCLENILQMCIWSGVTDSEYKKLSNIGLTSEQATICEDLPSYQDFLDAGWTSGYEEV